MFVFNFLRWHFNYSPARVNATAKSSRSENLGIFLTLTRISREYRYPDRRPRLFKSPVTLRGTEVVERVSPLFPGD